MLWSMTGEEHNGHDANTKRIMKQIRLGLGRDLAELSHKYPGVDWICGVGWKETGPGTGISQSNVHMVVKVVDLDVFNEANIEALKPTKDNKHAN